MSTLRAFTSNVLIAVVTSTSSSIKGNTLQFKSKLQKHILQNEIMICSYRNSFIIRLSLMNIGFVHWKCSWYLFQFFSSVQLMSGEQTVRKWGLSLPIVYFMTSVVNWEQAAPKPNTIITQYAFQTQPGKMRPLMTTFWSLLFVRYSVRIIWNNVGNK